MSITNNAGETFGAWLLKQHERGDRIDGLAEAARADRRFPRNGTPDGARERLRVMQADADLLSTVNDAEMEWLGYDSRKAFGSGRGCP